jgi:hypothetical protein
MMSNKKEDKCLMFSLIYGIYQQTKNVDDNLKVEKGQTKKEKWTQGDREKVKSKRQGGEYICIWKYICSCN